MSLGGFYLFSEAVVAEEDRYVEPSSIVEIRETGGGQYVRPGCPPPQVLNAQLPAKLAKLVFSSPAGTMGPPSVSGRTGPGSVRVSEIDLSSPLNYGTPSPGSSIR